MKRFIVIALALVMVMGMAIGTASAANSLKTGTLGMSIGVTDDYVIAGKYFTANDLAIIAGLGIRAMGGDAEGTDIGIRVGARKYLRTDDFAPFVGGQLDYSSTNDGNTTSLTLMGVAGAEYFFAKQFSVEGSVGFGYGSQEDKTPSVDPITGATTSTSVKASAIGTSRAAVSVNFYF